MRPNTQAHKCTHTFLAQVILSSKTQKQVACGLADFNKLVDFNLTESTRLLHRGQVKESQDCKQGFNTIPL